ncbi:NrfD/PsrC family molybdoenzyme membrane anchor subunit [Geoalkalibacter sp.]|uniref:NrfD/PsrC family molybdoenzyme membrane anchor subunit n=1 Tax=Geoalkalibacter sp. TaxID=3041440 RepID=UPI00272E3137|nr:NrfD/PsrC family molybdoenzyme membrane anchor subunit [Geoalkalibacter sp.]
MKAIISRGFKPIDSPSPDNSARRWTLKEKLLLGMTPRQYFGQAVCNPFNWVLGLIFLIGVPLLIYRFAFGLGAVTHSSYDYPWGLLLGFGLFVMVPLSASGFLLGTAVNIFGRHDLHHIERLALLNGLLGYFFAVVFLLADLGQPWRLPYPMFVAFGTGAVLFLVAWHVSTYLSVQVAEVSEGFFEWMNWPQAAKFVKKITVGLTVSAIILSTLHQGALGALFTYAPGKLHPLWYAAEFQWIHFFCSSIAAGLCMVIVVSTIIKKTMAWRCDAGFLDNLDAQTITLAKGACMALITYFAIKMLAVAHDNEWAYLATGWGLWFLFELAFGILLPLVILSYGIRRERAGIVRLGAFATVLGIALNRLNCALIAFNWRLYQEVPHWAEVMLCVTIFALYIVVYRAILYRLPILYSWKAKEAHAPEAVKERIPFGVSVRPSHHQVFRTRD